MRKVPVCHDVHVSIDEDIVVRRYMDGRNKPEVNNKQIKATTSTSSLTRLLHSRRAKYLPSFMTVTKVVWSEA